MSEARDRSGSGSPLRIAGRIAHAFIDSKLTPLAIAAALLAGVFSIVQTPREEEPQIVVPMLDISVQMPGASSKEGAERATIPMEKLLVARKAVGGAARKRPCPSLIHMRSGLQKSLQT